MSRDVVLREALEEAISLLRGEKKFQVKKITPFRAVW